MCYVNTWQRKPTRTDSFDIKSLLSDIIFNIRSLSTCKYYMLSKRLKCNFNDNELCNCIFAESEVSFEIRDLNYNENFTMKINKVL